MAIKKEILDELLKDRDPKTLFSSDGLLGELKELVRGRMRCQKRWRHRRHRNDGLAGCRHPDI